MKATKFVAILLTVFVLTNCTKDETPAPKPNTEEQPKPEETQDEIYFSYSSYVSPGADHWIIIHDSDGNLVDFKKAVNREILEFMMAANSIPEKISVTEFIYFEGFESSLNHRMYTHTNIEAGSALHKSSNYTPPVEIGTFDLRVDNIPGLFSHFFSVEGGRAVVGETNTEGSFLNTALNLNEAKLYENEDYVLSIYDKSGNHKYLVLENLTDGSDLVYDYSELNEYDSYLEIDMPVNNSMWLYTYGYSEDDPNYNFFGQTLSNYRGIEYSETVKAGYLDKYKKYKTEFNISLADCIYNFVQTGDKVENLEVPTSPNYVLNNSSIYDLKITTNLSLSSKYSAHAYFLENDNGGNIHTQWSVYSTGENFHKVGQLPQELISQYPALNLDKLEVITVTLFTQGYTPQEIFDQLTTNEKKGNRVVENYLFIHL